MEKRGEKTRKGEKERDRERRRWEERENKESMKNGLERTLKRTEALHHQLVNNRPETAVLFMLEVRATNHTTNAKPATKDSAVSRQLFTNAEMGRAGGIARA